jgi:hypothetical protein
MIDHKKVLNYAMLASMAILVLFDFGTDGALRLMISVVMFPLITMGLTFIYGLFHGLVLAKAEQVETTAPVPPEILGHVVGKADTKAGSFNGVDFPEWVDIQMVNGPLVRYTYDSLAIPGRGYPSNYVRLTFDKVELMYCAAGQQA